MNEADAPHYAGVEGIFDLFVNLMGSGRGWVFQSSLKLSLKHLLIKGVQRLRKELIEMRFRLEEIRVGEVKLDNEILNLPEQ
ncbi:MAG TPA: hypothetical protein ENG09_06055 [Candidatus Syntrophoarchaeum butanivorans]|uniref:Uncharacterized protein n=1 Tax=Candidatus Syntropharchaeum butanivorans TaxID=1839936 RepID=A0A7C1B862_9EURY|nr:hypothetical protein [Candidatus Syntrophoarchaeum butanivorans]